MKHSIKTGLSFGLTSGVITTIGLIVGLGVSTSSKFVVLGGILTIAIADALSDAMGIHISEESRNKPQPRAIWEATISTFVAKFIFALTFAIPVLIFSINTAILISIVWGLLLLGIFSYSLAYSQKRKSWKIILEHILIALFVIFFTYLVGNWIKSVFR